ncbi:dihydrofolate reductase family protein [Polycladidibacter stylochi]|uniref:dihydrofolate reductase family protein n=1 Tax=Polycladidibacter stylochi TaxID=1807766 RepID=UPI00082BC66B|nr:dihydrofolate reductase family protein [Pseudovibrio stylochi]
MADIVYYVACSLDGFIATLDGSAEFLPQQGPHADEYFKKLANFDHVLMGRNTYEYGYAFGLTPGKRAYPHMQHHIISKTLDFGAKGEVDIVRQDPLTYIEQLKRNAKTDIYLCGGGQLAGLLASNNLIDQLKLKVAPVAIGSGIALFGANPLLAEFTLTNSKSYTNGVTLAEYILKS